MNCRLAIIDWRLRLPACFAALVAAGWCVAAGCERAGLWPEAQSRGPAATARETESRDQYTILLYAYSGPDHVSRIADYKARTEKHAGWRGLRVVNKAGRSELCWGNYPSIEAAHKDLAKARAYRTPAGIAVYANAIILPILGKDIGPPEWNLRNATGAYTVMVAEFYNMPESKYYTRKADAVAYCRRLRDNGFEAYYLHGTVKSLVTVGAFPDSSIRMIREGDTIHPKILDARIEAILKHKQFEYLAVNGSKELVKMARLVDKTRVKVEAEYLRPIPIHMPDKKEGDVPSGEDRPGHAEQW